MHNQRRLISVLLTMVMVALIFWGSNGELSVKGQGDSEEEAGWIGKKETIYVWYTDPDLESYLNSAAVSFSEAEGVRVIPILKSASTLLQDAYQATMDPEQTMPDAFVINNDELEQAYLSGLAMEIENKSDIMNELWYPRTALSAVKYHSKLVAYPFYYETSILVYNKDYIEMWLRQQADRPVSTGEGEEETYEEASWSENCVGSDGVPLTVEGLMKFADTFDAPEGVEGVMKWDVADIFYNYWIVGDYLIIGGECGDDKLNVNICNEETIECLNTYQALSQFFFIEQEDVGNEAVLQEFMEGKMVFTIGNTDVVRKLEQAKQEGTFLYDYGVAKLPDISETLKSKTLSVTNAMAINGFSEHKEIANRFAEYATRSCAGDLYAKSGKMATALQSCRDDATLTIFMEQYTQSVSLPKMMEIGNLWLQLEALFAKVWNGEEVKPLLDKLKVQISSQIGEE